LIEIVAQHGTEQSVIDVMGHYQLNPAVACYQNAVKLDPTFANAYELLGFVLATQKRAKEYARIRVCGVNNLNAYRRSIERFISS